MTEPLISEGYRAQQQALHAAGEYGTAALRFGPAVNSQRQRLGARSVLDYGCGSRRSLLSVLDLPDGVIYEGYDPAVPEFSRMPCPAELVVCIDVLEHIEPALLPNVLEHLKQLCDPHGFFSIHTGPAAKILPDGRNAHLIQQGPDWWLATLSHYFRVLKSQGIDGGFVVLVKNVSG